MERKAGGGRRKIAVYVLIMVAILVLIAVPIWLGTGPAVLAPTRP